MCGCGWIVGAARKRKSMQRSPKWKKDQLWSSKMFSRTSDGQRRLLWRARHEIKTTVVNTPNLSLKFCGHWVVWLRVTRGTDRKRRMRQQRRLLWRARREIKTHRYEHAKPVTQILWPLGCVAAGDAWHWQEEEDAPTMKNPVACKARDQTSPLWKRQTCHSNFVAIGWCGCGWHVVLTGRGGCANNEGFCGVQGARSKLTVMNTPTLSLKFCGHWVVWLRVTRGTDRKRRMRQQRRIWWRARREIKTHRYENAKPVTQILWPLGCVAAGDTWYWQEEEDAPTMKNPVACKARDQNSPLWTRQTCHSNFGAIGWCGCGWMVGTAKKRRRMQGSLTLRCKRCKWASRLYIQYELFTIQERSWSCMV